MSFTGIDRFNGVFFECPRPHAILLMAVVTRFLVVVPSSGYVECSFCVRLVYSSGHDMWFHQTLLKVIVPRFLFLQIVSLAFRIQSVCDVSEVLFFG